MSGFVPAVGWATTPPTGAQPTPLCFAMLHGHRPNMCIRKQALKAQAIVASAVIERDGKILLVQQGGSTNYGRWNVPSGKVERGESVVEALAREVLEETGLEVEVAEPYAVYWLDLPDKRGGKIVYGCRATILGGQLQLRKEEILDARWFPISQVMQMPDERLCNPRDLRRGLRDYLLVYSTSTS